MLRGRDVSYRLLEGPTSLSIERLCNKGKAGFLASDASLNVGLARRSAGDERLKGASQAPEAPVDGGVLAQAPVPLAVGFDVGADLAVGVEEGEAAEPEARVLAGADDAEAPDEALEASEEINHRAATSRRDIYNYSGCGPEYHL